ncbi:MAG: nickel-dependent lactate racemase [Pyrinomonadaceae bacterium]|nr:nickel-dependent lactate racemase [Pyrinomonadaceae bacterium]
MANIQLGYGKDFINFEFDANRFDVLARLNSKAKPLADSEINAAIDAPIDSDSLENAVDAGDSVLIVVSDATRQTASAQIVNLLVRRLIANGVMPFDIRVIFATGIHRQVTQTEKLELLTPFIVQRIKTLDHNPRDLTQIVKFGFTKRGTPIELNRALIEHDKIILVGGVSFHYFAGFGGGRKLIGAGLASSKTINETHKLNFDFETKTRRENVGTAILSGNPVHEEFIEIIETVSEKINIAFAINSIVDENGFAIEVFAGNWRTAHEKACQIYLENNSVKIAEKRETVIVSCGGSPLDLNLIQAHKALETAALACAEGGIIIWLARCEDGTGREDFINWFQAETSQKLATDLQAKFQVNGQTAWSLLSKAERFRVFIISELPESETRRMRLHPARDLNEALSTINAASKGYILPFGAKVLPLFGS